MSEEQVTGVPEEGVAQSVDDSTTGDWRTMIPDEIRAHQSLQHITDVGALAKSYVHAQQMIGADKVAIPSKHSSPEDWDYVYERLGRPEAPDMYELATPEGLEDDGSGLDWYRQLAHEAGLNPRQAQKIFDAYNQYADSLIGESNASIEMHRENVERELRQEYGQAFDDKLDLALGVLNEFGAEDLTEIQLSDGSLLGDNPDVVRMLAEIGTFIQNKVGEDTLVGVKTSGGITPDEAKAQLAELQHKDSPYWDARHKDHHDYVQRSLALQEKIFGHG